MAFCTILSETISGFPVPNFNVYDIREKCEHPPLCYDFSSADNLMNDKDVKRILGVENRHWSECSMMVHSYLLGDWMLNLMPQVASLLDETNIEVLVYSGDQDWICNWRGGEAWTLATKWEHQTQFAE